jgi:hypothetical protein
MPIRFPLSYRKETISNPAAISIFYFFDPDLGKWVSSHLDVYQFGRNAAAVTGFLRSPGNVVLSSTHGYLLPHQGTLIALTAKATNTPAEQDIKVYNGGSLILNQGWGAQELNITTNIDLVLGTLSVEVQNHVPATAPVKPDNPIVSLYVRWRL